MKFHAQNIQGVFLIESTPFVDERGVYRRHFCDQEFSEQGIVTNIRQCNVSENPYNHTMRGFHYQLPPHSEGKTLSCLKGAIYDIIIDLRTESPTYMQWISFEINDENRCTIHIPPGCANAFLTLEDHCLIHYYCSHPYTPSAERGIRYNDPAFEFEWPYRPEVISEKDLNHPDYQKVLL